MLTKIINNLGNNYTTEPKTIDGYTLTTTPTSSQTVTYVYTKNIEAAEPVTVNYVDATGKTLAPSETLNGNVGDTYNATAKQIDGYTLSAEPTNATGQFTNSAQTVNYIYTKNTNKAVQFKDNRSEKSFRYPTKNRRFRTMEISSTWGIPIIHSSSYLEKEKIVKKPVRINFPTGFLISIFFHLDRNTHIQ
ncbi:Internalin-J [Listeria monocytogenes N53-1]|nr:Internalin-J [Listeria monocytogenes N53-1]